MKEQPCFCPPFTEMATVLETGKCGHMSITHFTLKTEEAKWLRLSSIFAGNYMEDRFTEPGTYVRLYDDSKREIVMTDTGMERWSNLNVVESASGKVLIAGLGIGMILLPIAAKPEVTYIRVVEIDKDVLDLVWPQISKKLGKKLAGKIDIVMGDINEYDPSGEKWDTAYFDIWNNICADNYPGMKTLHRRFSRSLNRENPSVFMESWRRDRCKKEYLEEMSWAR